MILPAAMRLVSNFVLNPENSILHNVLFDSFYGQ
jgi:hypothetical protein